MRYAIAVLFVLVTGVNVWAVQADEKRHDPSSLHDRMKSFSEKVHIGGYLDLEYVNTENSNSDTFDAHRFVPFFFADVSDNISIAAELEIEHGEDLGIEFGVIDYEMKEWINFRAGILLLPLGKFNLVHDAPYQDLTLRPLVDTWIIPAVLRDPGISFFGRMDKDSWYLDYEFAISNGFKGMDKTGATLLIDESNGLRDARPHNDTLGSGYRDFNDNKAITGRVSVVPFLGLEAGLSFHQGKYDEAGDGDLQIMAIDSTIHGGGLYNELVGGKTGMLRDWFFASEFVFEYARAEMDRTDVSPAGAPEDLSGGFLEYRYHFFPDFFKDKIPGATDESTFTAIFRYDVADLDGSETERMTLGLNFRPMEATVFKIEHHRVDESGDKIDVDDDQFVFSVATYF